MPETITMTFHPLSPNPEKVKPRRLAEFQLNTRVVSTHSDHAGGHFRGTRVRVAGCVPGYSGPKVLTPSGVVDGSYADECCWYLESDWINGRPREIPAEAVRKAIGELKTGEVFGYANRRWRVASGGHVTFDDNVVAAELGGNEVWIITKSPTDIVTLLGYVTFECEGARP